MTARRRTLAHTSLVLAAVVLAGIAANACDELSSAPPEPLIPDHPGTHLPASADIHVPGGVTLEPFARGTFPHEIDAMFKFRYDPAVEVVHLRDASDAIAARLTIAEGGSVGWHRHPGSAIGIVASGTFGVIEDTDCVERHYAAGEAVFHRGQGILDVGFNAGQGDVVVYLFFLDVPPGEGPTHGAPEEAPC